MKRNSRLVFAFALVVVLVFVLAGCYQDGATTTPGYVSGDGVVTEWSPTERGEPVELTGRDFAGNDIDLADYRGQVVVLTTWFAACPPCRVEAPLLVEIDGNPEVAVVGINSRDAAATAQAFERTFGITYPSIDDADGRAIAQLQGMVAVNAVPTALILDQEGRIAARTVGLVEPSTLRSLLEAAGQR